MSSVPVRHDGDDGHHQRTDARGGYVNERADRIARGWDEAAEGYQAYFVPRFSPWVSAAVRALAIGALPDGPILVPCCGTFPELDRLLEHFPDRELAGIDLSAGMVRRARERAARRRNVTVVQGDASRLDSRWTGRCAALVSVFGLQQLPRPGLALRSWLAALRPAGRLSVVYWPHPSEREGPFARISDVGRPHVAAGDHGWERELAPALTAHGAVIERDEDVAFPMSHPDAPTFFDAYVYSGPLRSLAIDRGDAFVAALRQEFLREAPAGEWNHRPRGRLIVARQGVEDA
jgi:SAM-dependent methyltransferase